MSIDKEQLIKLLSKNDACTPSLFSLRNMSVDEMLKHYVDNIDYGIAAGFMDRDFFLDNANTEQLYNAGLYVGMTYGRLNNKPLAVVIDSVLNLQYDKYSVGNLHIRDCKTTVVNCFDNSSVFIDVYGNSNVEINQHNSAKVMVTTHGCNCTVKVLGNVKLLVK